MKISKLLILFFISFTAFAQQKIEKHYYDAEDKNTDSLHAVTFSHYIFSDTITGRGVVKTFDSIGKLTRKTMYANINIKNDSIKRWTREGFSKYYHDNGEIKIIETYKKNKLDGEITTYYKNKQLKRKDIFKENKFISGACFNTDGTEIKHFDYFIPAEYAGGQRAIYKFISSKLRYPSIMEGTGTQGKVIIQFKITKEAKLKNVRVTKSPHPHFSREAKRVVHLLTDWKPGERDGEKVDVRYNLPITFRLD